MAKLTNKVDAPFELCFKYPLENNYTLETLSKRNVNEFQSFLDKVSKMNVQQVDALYSRKPDLNDKYHGMQVYHYEVKKGFRIHVVIEAGYYVIIRFDPNHKFHG